MQAYGGSYSSVTSSGNSERSEAILVYTIEIFRRRQPEVGLKTSMSREWESLDSPKLKYGSYTSRGLKSSVRAPRDHSAV